MTANSTDGWRLAERQGTSAGEVAYGVFGGEGPPVVLVHGTPSRSLIWRHVVAALERRHRVYVYDLLGFGDSERYESQDVSSRPRAGRCPNWSRRGDSRGRWSRDTT